MGNEGPDSLTGPEARAWDAELLGTVSDAIIVVDDAWRIRWMNCSAERLYGWRTERVQEQPLDELLQTQYVDVSARHVRELLVEAGRWSGRLMQRDRVGSLLEIRTDVFARCEPGRGGGTFVWVNRRTSERHDIEAALDESRERLEAFYHAAFEGLAIVEHGRFVDVNERFCEMFGYQRDELIGMSVEALVAPEDRELVRERIRSGYAADYEHRALRKDGTRLWVEVHGTSSRFEGRPVRLTAIHDLTARMQAEAERERWAHLVEHASWGMAVTNADGTRLERVNPSFARMHGYPVEELEGVPLSQICPLGEAGNLADGVAAAHHPGAPASFEAVNVRQDGSTFPVSVDVTVVSGSDGEPRYRSVFVQDVSLRHAAERERDRLSATVEQAAEAMLITDRRGIIEYANPAFERSTGCRAAEAIGKPLDFLHANDGPARLGQAEWDALEAGYVWRGRLTSRRRDGTLLYEEVVISPLRDAREETTNYVVVKRDVTREVELEAQLRHVQKLESIGTLAGGIAHDFNNILGVISTCTRLALDGQPPQAPTRSDLEQVLRATQRGRSMVEKILTFSRRADVQKEWVDVSSVVQDVAGLLRGSIPPTIEVRAQAAANLSVFANADQLHQVVTNLGTNAYHAMRERGGTLSLDVDLVEIPSDGPRRQPGLAPGTYVRLVVGDTGEGMTPEQLERACEPFFTTKPVGEGTGLGLPVVHGIVADHGGVMDIETTLGRGTTVSVLIPGGEERPSRTVSERPPSRGSGERLLLVDDDPALAFAGRRLLERLGYEVSAFTDPKQALAAFREEPSRFRLVVTDQAMPGMSGGDLAREILALAPDLPIVLCTGYGAGLDESSWRQLGIAALVAKPFEPQELTLAIARALTARPSG